jgi:hypothetical protein
MAEKVKGLLDGAAGDALSEGAARFDRLIESVKAQPAAPAASAPQPVRNPLMAVSPEENWAKRFDTQAVGSDFGARLPVDIAPLPHAVVVPVPQIVPSRAAEALARPSVQPLGAEIGKPVRRSWLGRVFGRG